MLPPIPYLDLGAYKLLSEIDRPTIDVFASSNPGFIERMIARGSSRTNARLQKRYRVPLGQEAPTLVATGTAPPAVTLSGRPTVGSIEIVLQVTGSGALGVGFNWSTDGGQTFPNTGTTAPTVTLSGTGLTANFGVGPYSADNVYSASSPVPAIALGWIIAFVDLWVWRKRGANPQDPELVRAKEAYDDAEAEIKEAADSKDGLFDLPTNDVVGDSAIAQGGPRAYTETSPYVSADLQECQGHIEDAQGSGTFWPST